MSSEGVYMNVPAVERFADAFATFSDLMDEANSALEAALMILKATAFFGLVGNMALTMYLENIQPNVKALADKFRELKLDLMGAIVSYRDGDNSGSQRFA